MGYVPRGVVIMALIAVFAAVGALGALEGAIAASVGAQSGVGPRPPAGPVQAGSAEVAAYLPLLLQNAVRGILLDPPTAVPATATTHPTEVVPRATSTTAITVAPSATASATSTSAPPTETATPTPSPTPTVALNCSQILPNGDFEQGASIWELTVNAQKEHPSQAIKRADAFGIPAKGGDQMALLGGVLNAGIDLRNPRVAGVDAERLASVKLHYWVLMMTNETRNGRADDEIEAWLSVDDREFPVEGTRFSEETMERQQWLEVNADITEIVKRRGRKEFIFRARHNDVDGTWFFVDEATITACINPGD